MPRHKRNGRRLWRSLWRRILRWRYLLFQRGRHNRLVLEQVAGRPILVLPQVLNPKLFRTGAFLAQTLSTISLPPEALVLDMGTGTGVGAIAAAAQVARVVAVDVNPEAVRCSRINVLLNRVEDRVEVLEGDLFAPLNGRRFDVVLFNPPYLRGEPQTLLDRALYATDVVERFAADLQEHLRPGGYTLLLLSSDADEMALLQSFARRGFDAEVIATRDLYSEVATIYRLRCKQEWDGNCGSSGSVIDY